MKNPQTQNSIVVWSTGIHRIIKKKIQGQMWDASVQSKTAWEARQLAPRSLWIFIYICTRRTQRCLPTIKVCLQPFHTRLPFTVMTDVLQELTATGWQGARYPQMYGFIWSFGQINKNLGTKLNSKLPLWFVSVTHPTPLNPYSVVMAKYSLLLFIYVLHFLAL